MGKGKPWPARLIFVAAGIGFYTCGIVLFLRRGQWLGGVVSLAAGTWFLVKSCRWGR